jgi:hypothetical protein
VDDLRPANAMKTFDNQKNIDEDGDGEANIIAT